MSSPNYVCPVCEKLGLEEPEDDGQRWNCFSCGMLMYREDELELVIRLEIGPDHQLVVPKKEKPPEPVETDLFSS